MNTSPPLLTVQNLKVHFGGKPLFNNLSFGLFKGDRISLVGRNGSGKSTLLKVLAGLQDLDEGECIKKTGLKIAYVPQDPILEGETGLDAVSHNLPSEDMYKVYIYADLFQADLSQKLSVASGGELRRFSLIQALIHEPDVLLLDEPTNHLDIQAIEKLEEIFLSFQGALVVISHDRALLNKVTRQVFWLDRGELRQKEIAFTAFEEWQEDIFSKEQEAMHRLDRKIAAETLWLREGLSGRRKRNMGRVRALNTLTSKQKNYQGPTQKVSMASPQAEGGGQVVFDIKNLTKNFEDLCIVKDFTYKIRRGDKIGLIGPNGVGKSTFLKMLLDEIEPNQGFIKKGVNLLPVYFDQKRETLDLNSTLMGILCPEGGDTVTLGNQTKHVVSYLKDFLFTEDQARGVVKNLSGGEKNRLMFAEIMARPHNVLILDEPTNDLDLETLDILEDVLQSYDGTLFVVSHDRDFLSRTVDILFAFEGQGTIRIVPGTYDDYIRERSKNPFTNASPKIEKASKSLATPKPSSKKLSYKDQRDLDLIPEKLKKLASVIFDIELMLADPNLYTKNPDIFTKLTLELAQKQQEKNSLEERLLELEILLEDIELQKL
jgi:ABC transport system ATP-binding/permease protein